MKDFTGFLDVVSFEGKELLSRYPKEIVDQLGHTIPFQHCGTTLSFIPMGCVKITLRSYASWVQPKVLLRYGCFDDVEEIMIEGDTEIVIEREMLFKHTLPSMEEDTSVVHVQLFGDFFEIVKVEGTYKKIEDSKKKILFYGTSITQGIGTTSVNGSYASLLSTSLKARMYNYALSGKCFLESYVIDSFLEANHYDYIVYECSVNALGLGMKPDEFKRRIDYLLDETSRIQKNARIVVTSILPFFLDLGIENPNDLGNQYLGDYRKIVALSCKERGIQYVDPFTLLQYNGLSKDVIHPSNRGMMQIARELERVLNDEYE